MIRTNQPPLVEYSDIDVAQFQYQARRKRGSNEKCWCGSGNKYNRCHKNRAKETPFPHGRFINEQNNIFWKTKRCMHPRASQGGCEGRVVDSHTIQKSGPIRSISTDSHVLTLQIDQLNPTQTELQRIGWKKASIFPGYCTKHDRETFLALELVPFTGDHNQCVVQSFRTLCNELYKKRSAIDVAKYHRRVCDKGLELDSQIQTQLSILATTEGQKKTIAELEALWKVYEDVVENEKYGDFKSRTYYFNGELCVTSAGIIHAEFDFDGNQLVDLTDLSKNAAHVSHFLSDTEDGCAFSFIWLDGDSDAEQVVLSFDNVPDDQKADILLQYCFLNCENTFFSEIWWKQLDSTNREIVEKYAGTLHHDGGTYSTTSEPMVKWKLTKST